MKKQEMACKMLLISMFALLVGPVAADGQKTHLKVVTIENKPYTYLDVESAPENGTAEWAGSMLDLFKALADQMGITYEVYGVPDAKYGHWDESSGEWSGMMGEVTRGNADVAVAPLTITAKRAAAVRFGRPLLPAGIVPLIRRPKPGDALPFNDLVELAAETKMLYGAIKDGATGRFFLNAPEGSLYRHMGEFMVNHTDTVLATTYQEGVARVREGGYVFFGEQAYLQMIANKKPCNIMVVGEPITQRSYGFAFRNDLREMADKFDQALIEHEWLAKKLLDSYDRQCEHVQLCRCAESDGDSAADDDFWKSRNYTSTESMESNMQPLGTERELHDRSLGKSDEAQPKEVLETIEEEEAEDLPAAGKLWNETSIETREVEVQTEAEMIDKSGGRSDENGTAKEDQDAEEAPTNTTAASRRKRQVEGSNSAGSFVSQEWGEATTGDDGTEDDDTMDMSEGLPEMVTNHMELREANDHSEQ